MQKYVNLIAFLWKLISKEHIVVIMEFLDWAQVEKYTYSVHYNSPETLQLHCMSVLLTMVYC